MRLNENKFLIILAIVMLCCMLGILVFGTFWGISTVLFEDTLIEIIAKRIFLIDMAAAFILFIVFLFSMLLLSDKDTEHIVNMEEIPEEFEVLYTKLKEEVLDDFEKERSKISLWKKIELVLKIGFIASIFLYAFASVIFLLFDSIFLILVLAVTLGFFFVYKSNKKRVERFNRKYKEIVINQMIKNMGHTGLKFTAEDKEKEHIYSKLYASIFSLPQEEYSYYKNFIEGSYYKDLDINFTDMYLSKRTYGRNRFPHVYFSGYFGCLNFKKSLFNGFSISKKDIYMQKKFVRHTNNEYFDKHFSLASNNGRFKSGLIRDGIADVVARFYSSTNIKLEIMTRGEKIFFKIYSSSIFEPCFSNKNKYKEKIYTQYYFLNEFFILIEEIYDIIKNNCY